MDLIQEPTNQFNKYDFFKSLYDYGQDIKIKCINVSDVTKSKINNSYLIYLTLEILNEFPIYKKVDQDKEIKLNPLNQIIKIAYTIKETRINNIYEVSNHSNLYPLLNYALIQNKLIPENNGKGFNISLEEIQENLNGTIFNIKCDLEKNTSYKPYYKLITCKN